MPGLGLDEVLKKIDNTNNMQELANVVHQLPDIARGLHSDAQCKAISSRVESKRRFFKEHKYIVHMTVEDRQSYLAYNPCLRNYAQNIQDKVQQELQTPTLRYVADILKTLKYSNSTVDIQMACLKVTQYLHDNALDLNWQYSVYVELITQLRPKLIAEYTKLAPTLSKQALQEKIASLKQEIYAAVFRLGICSEYEVILDRCADICRAARKTAINAQPVGSQQLVADVKCANKGYFM